MNKQPLSLPALQSLLKTTQDMLNAAGRQDWDLVLEQDKQRLKLLNTNSNSTDTQGTDAERLQLSNAIRQADADLQALAVNTRSKHAHSGADHRARQTARQGYLSAQSLVHPSSY